jgi:hypothetical protein
MELYSGMGGTNVRTQWEEYSGLFKEKRRAERPHEIWGIDMTKFMVSDLGWVYLVIVIDWYTKKIVG